MRKRINAKSSKRFSIIISLLLITLIASAGTLAWVTATTGPVENQFKVGSVILDINEDFNNETKSNVTVTNNGNCTGYIRAAIIPTWGSYNEDGKFTAVNKKASLNDLNITYGSDNWKKAQDGYYYYIKPVPAGMTTEKLIETATVATIEDSYHMNLQIVVDSIQAQPNSAVLSQWKQVTAVAEDGTLTVIQN